MKIAVVGSRNINDYELIKSHLNLIKENISLIVSGGAIGVDSLSEQYAKENNIPTKIFIPNWNKFGKAAGMIRNKDIVSESDMVIAFWDGISRGTKNSIDHAKRMNKELKIIIVK